MATEETLKAELQEQGHSSQDAAEHAEALTGIPEAAPQAGNQFVTEAALVLLRPGDGKEVIFMRGERLPEWAAEAQRLKLQGSESEAAPEKQGRKSLSSVRKARDAAAKAEAKE